MVMRIAIAEAMRVAMRIVIRFGRVSFVICWMALAVPVLALEMR